MEQRNAISSAVMAADTATASLSASSTEADLTAADSAVMAANEAIAAGTDLPSSETDANTATVAAYDDRIAAARMAIADAADEAEKARQAEMAKNGKALKGALTQTPLSYAPAVTALTSSGVTIGYNHDFPTDADGTGTANLSTGSIKKGASAGSLGSWNGTNYLTKNAGTGVTNQAVLYTNRAAAKSYPIATRYATATNVPTNAGTYTPADRQLSLGDAADSNIKADMFPTAGETTFTPTAPSNEILVPGTYQGAAGDYRCTGTCTATAGASGVITLSADWVFIHDSGAMVSISDANYLVFGWWLRKDKDDKPTQASAFTHVVGDVDGDVDLTNPSTLAGKATYSGHAAGKFAIHDPLTGTGDAGHFTADATLNATFGTGATNGLSGMIDNFMANEQSVPWSVTLFRRSWDTTNSGQVEAADDPDTAGVNESVTQTVWSIGGNSAAASGTWDAMMYDEKPGNAPSGDGSNVATSVTGTFQSHYGSTHTMVGAFGATKD